MKAFGVRLRDCLFGAVFGIGVCTMLAYGAYSRGHIALVEKHAYKTTVGNEKNPINCNTLTARSGTDRFAVTYGRGAGMAGTIVALDKFDGRMGSTGYFRAGLILDEQRDGSGRLLSGPFNISYTDAQTAVASACEWEAGHQRININTRTRF